MPAVGLWGEPPGLIEIDLLVVCSSLVYRPRRPHTLTLAISPLYVSFFSQLLLRSSYSERPPTSSNSG